MDLEDILLYADDILLLCQTTEQIKRCIQIIEEWSKENGMQLNKKKSGIVVFSPRSARNIPYMVLHKDKEEEMQEWTPALKEIKGVPLQAKYKYLGTYLDSKLTMSTQLNFIRKKTNFLFVKLYPYLSNASADSRKDMWRTLIFPLFNAVLTLLRFESSKNHLDNMINLWHYSFKKFMMIPQSTSTDIVDEMIGIDLCELVSQNAEIAKDKWMARKERKNLEKVKKKETENYLKGIPKEWCEILKQQCSLCPLCKNATRNAKHMAKIHNIDIYSYREIWSQIKEVYKQKHEQHKNKKTIMKLKRVVLRSFWEHRLKALKEDTEAKYKQIYNRIKYIRNK